MSASDRRRGKTGTYFITEHLHREEAARLLLQEEIITRGMGGLLSEQTDPASFRQILDIGCGSGGWLVEVARTYPGISSLVGIDISEKLLSYARKYADTRQVSERVEFRHMDALHGLNFPDGSFDLVNERLGQTFVRTWEWPGLLRECQRVCKPGKMIRLTESNFGESTSSALMRLCELFTEALYHSGHLFTVESKGMANDLAGLMSRHGIQNVQTRAYTLEYRAGTPEGKHFYEDIRSIYQNVQPFLQKWACIPDDYEEIYQQAMLEMQLPDALTTWFMRTAWGISNYSPQTNLA